MKTLLIVTTGLPQLELSELLRREAADEFPRVTLFETVLNADIVNERFLQRIPNWRKLLFRFLPASVSQVLEAYYNRNNYEVIISWSERRAFLFALLLKLTRSKTKHIGLFYWISKPKQSLLLRVVHSHIHRVITWSSMQRDYAIHNLSLTSSKVKYIPYGVDQQFWRPVESEQNMICSVGEEMRDYATLIEAMRGLPFKCHIVGEKIRIIGRYFSTSKNMEEYGPLPQNVTASRMNYQDLRSLYSKSRFVVLPILESETSSGLTVLLEAMSMGKAVICSKIKGQVDVVQNGKTGLFVPPGNPSALREAIQYLWDRPDVAQQMGKEARRYIEQHHTLDQFVGSVKSIVEELAGKRFNHIAENVSRKKSPLQEKIIL
jgi:glycosyltransferase involved in cell wall biosynthesis